ncbi:MAG: hydantoinase/oxoprolinase family protein [Deltaproteobacteria bacterium]|nr:hydantoinase/oxoprolinase family protein [Deltaproteobacteria bacterium]
MIIGLDVGGTHTDVVLLGAKGLVREVKVPTDPSNLFETVLTGLRKITEGIDSKKITRAVFSTTLTTNAVVQKKFPPVGIIVTAGPGLDPALFRIGAHYHIVAGAIDHRGRELTPIDPDEVDQVAQALKKEGIQYVAVTGKFATRNPAHELAVKKQLASQFDRVFLSHELSGNLNFPRRIATTYLNAAVFPVHRAFFEAVEHSMGERGLNLPIRILKPDGGNMGMDASIDFPGYTILSGPAASVMGAISHAAKDSESLVLDIGGTTTDMALLINGVPLLDPKGIELAGFKTLIRAMQTQSLGLGGDSAISVTDGKLSIGPERKGPAMAFGGPAPTPTDALFVMGKLADGDRDRAAEGIQSIADALNKPPAQTAQDIFDLTCRRIFSAAQAMINQVNSKPVYTVHELLEGHQVKPKEILVLGGPAAQFADHLSTISGLNAKIVPNHKVANAIGAGLARTTCEVTLFADTQIGMAMSPEENISLPIDKSFDSENAEEMALDLLKTRAIKLGADPDRLDMEVIENMQFNMVRGFYTAGKNIRVKVQIKPGLIQGDELFSDG